MRSLIKIILFPFGLIGIVLGVLYTLGDFIWFMVKETHEEITKFIHKTHNNEQIY